MKKPDKKKLAAMIGSGMLTVSCLVGCVYGPEPEQNLNEQFTLHLGTEHASSDAGSAESDQ